MGGQWACRLQNHGECLWLSIISTTLLWYNIIDLLIYCHLPRTRHYWHYSKYHKIYPNFLTFKPSNVWNCFFFWKLIFNFGLDTRLKYSKLPSYSRSRSTHDWAVSVVCMYGWWWWWWVFGWRPLTWCLVDNSMSLCHSTQHFHTLDTPFLNTHSV